LCVPVKRRAMPENEKSSAMRMDVYLIYKGKKITKT